MTYGGLSACSNAVHVNRERAELRITEHLSDELLSEEAIALAKKKYQEAMREALNAHSHTQVPKPDQLAAEEAHSFGKC